MNLIRLVSGSPRSLVVQVSVGISAHMTRKGLFAQWRVNVLDPVAIDWSLVGLADASLPPECLQRQRC
jgi:hypothetical protein